MTDRIVVKRYAEAFVNFAKETVGLQKAFTDLKNLEDAIRANPEAMEFLRSLDIMYSEKAEFIEKIFKKDLSPEAMGFLRLLLKKGRIDKVVDIAEYIRLTYAQEGTVAASLRSAFALDGETVKNIQEVLEKKFRKKIKFDIGIDKDLLGGVQIVMGNIVIDGTAKRRLEDLKEKLMTARVD